ncbi:MAG: isoprenylcysteine carboxylmethyltransferase family protein [Brevinematales bacterium]
MKDFKRLLKIPIIPIMLSIAVPFIIILSEHLVYRHPIITSFAILFAIGVLLTSIGFIFLIMTIRTKIFMIIGGWDPAGKLVLAGLYCRVRNPMIVSEIILQAGESFLFASYGIAGLAVINFIVHTVYFILVSEPDLEKRFGQEYIDYKKYVPRWMPRLNHRKSPIIITGKEGPPVDE